MENRCIVDALVDLGEKVTGKEIDVKGEEKMLYGEDITEVIDAITENYSAGGGGTTVVANPELAGTEDTLTGLQVGDTKYKIETGGGNSALVLTTFDFTASDMEITNQDDIDKLDELEFMFVNGMANLPTSIMFDFRDDSNYRNVIVHGYYIQGGGTRDTTIVMKENEDTITIKKEYGGEYWTLTVS